MKLIFKKELNIEIQEEKDKKGNVTISHIT